MLRNLIKDYSDAIQHQQDITKIAKQLSEAMLAIHSDATKLETGSPASYVMNYDESILEKESYIATDPSMPQESKLKPLDEIQDEIDKYDVFDKIAKKIEKILFNELRSININFISNPKACDNLCDIIRNFMPPDSCNDLQQNAIATIAMTIASVTLPAIQIQQQMRNILDTLAHALTLGQKKLNSYPTTNQDERKFITKANNQLLVLNNTIASTKDKALITPQDIKTLKTNCLSTANNIKDECKKYQYSKDLYTRLSEWANDIRYKIFGAGKLSMKSTLFSTMSDNISIAKSASRYVKLVMPPQKKQ